MHDPIVAQPLSFTAQTILSVATLFEPKHLRFGLCGQELSAIAPHITLLALHRVETARQGRSGKVGRTPFGPTILLVVRQRRCWVVAEDWL